MPEVAGIGDIRLGLKCAVIECPYKARAKGYCDNHYRLDKRYGDPKGGPGRGVNFRAVPVSTSQTDKEE